MSFKNSNKSNKFVPKPFSVKPCVSFYNDAKENGTKILSYQLNKTSKTKEEKQELISSFQEKVQGIIQFFEEMQQQHDEEESDDD